jgi:hypothetical protein
MTLHIFDFGKKKTDKLGWTSRAEHKLLDLLRIAGRWHVNSLCSCKDEATGELGNRYKAV